MWNSALPSTSSLRPQSELADGLILPDKSKEKGPSIIDIELGLGLDDDEFAVCPELQSYHRAGSLLSRQKGSGLGSLTLLPRQEGVRVMEVPVMIVPPEFDKDKEEDTFLTRTLRTNHMFQNLPDATLHKLVLAFEQVDARKGSDVICQGDSNIDYFYVLRNGECIVTVDGKQLPDNVVS